MQHKAFNFYQAVLNKSNLFAAPADIAANRPIPKIFMKEGFL